MTFRHRPRMSAAKGSRMLRRLYDWTLRQAAHRHAEPVLATVSFTESSVFPIPADVLFIPMCLARPDRAMRYAALATVASVLGGVAGWLIGRFAFALIARPLLEFYGKLDAFQALAASGPGLVLLLLVTSGFSHLPPMKVVTILAGLIGFPLVPFVASAIVARGGRFFLLGWLLRHYGRPILGFIERRFPWIAAGVILLGALAYLLVKGVLS